MSPALFANRLRYDSGIMCCFLGEFGLIILDFDTFFTFKRVTQFGEDYLPLTFNGMQAEVLIVAVGMIVAIVSASAFGAGLRSTEDGLGYGGQGASLEQTAA